MKDEGAIFGLSIEASEGLIRQLIANEMISSKQERKDHSIRLIRWEVKLRARERELIALSDSLSDREGALIERVEKLEDREQEFELRVQEFRRLLDG